MSTGVSRPGTPLLSAVSRGHREVVNLLLVNGANVNAKDNDDRTPLSLAKDKGYEKIVELLRRHGAKE
ncbi:MAG TPA: ankyrin repeat domain-containing protein [Sedimentisphaerales bacterium]|nr:ankyrin repeat domain-containing protein [Sedimentisphaerales bacterium]